MRLTTVILIATFLQVSAATFGQRITLTAKRAPLSTVLKEIRKQSGFDFYYDDKVIPDTLRVSISVKDARLEEALEAALKGLKLKYEIDGKIVTLSRKDEKSSPDNLSNMMADIEVRGRVVSDKGEGLASATIKVKGTNKSATSADNGEFLLQGVNEHAVIIITFVGYKTREVQAASDLGNIVLQLDISRLDAIQIIGYGATTKRTNTGSVKSIKAEDIAKQPVTNPLLALQGNVAGLYVSQTNGLPGAAVNISIRGQNSIGAGNSPLYIIDGVPFNDAAINMQSGGSYSLAANGTTSPLNSINPGDIEDITILKDADATAIYGSRAANGVVLITTRKGKSGKARVDIDVYTGAGKVSRKMKMLNTEQYLALRRQAFENDNVVPNESNAPDLLIYGTGYTDFQERLIGNTAPLTQATMSISGGSQTTTFLLSGTWRKEGNVFPGDNGYQRGSILFNVNHNSADKRFNAVISTAISKDVNNLNPQDITSIAMSLPPNYPLHNPDGSLFWDNNFQNPLAVAADPSRSKTDNIITNVTVDYKIIPDLVIKASLGYNRMFNEERIAYLKSNAGPNGFETFSSSGAHFTEGFIVEPQLTYNKGIGNGKLQVLAGATYQYSEAQTPYTAGLLGFSNERLVFDKASAREILWLDSYASAYKYASVFGRANYQLDGKYIFNVSARRDGSSRFGPGKKFGTFGAAGVAWLFSQEEFAKNAMPFLSFGKLRGSYGVIGNDQIPNYGYLPTYRSNIYRYGSLPGVTPARIANPDYSWESTKKAELALELGFLQDRILLTAAAYRNRTSNMLVSNPLTPQTGFSSYMANLPATVQNTGIELELNTTNIQKKTFDWRTSLNLTIARNKLLSFPDIRSSSYAGEYVVGQPLGIITAYKVKGIVDGLVEIEDVNHDGLISTGIAENGLGDFIIAGQTAPTLFGGITNILQYRGVQLDLFVQFAVKDGYNNRYGSSRPPGSMYNQDANILKEGLRPTAEFGTAAYDSYILYTSSERVISDASFVRLKNVSLSYDLPQKWTKRLGMDALRFYVRGQNLVTLTSYQGLDPEIANSFNYIVPPLKLYTAGIQFSL